MAQTLLNKFAILLISISVFGIFCAGKTEAAFFDDFTDQNARWAWNYRAGTGFHNLTTVDGLSVVEAGITNLSTTGAYSDSSTHETTTTHTAGSVEMRIKCTDDDGLTDSGVGSRGWGYWNVQFGAQNNAAWFWMASPQSDAAYSGLRAMVIINGAFVYNQLLNVDVKQWHTYRVDLAPDGSHFYVDGAEVGYYASKPTVNMRVEMWLDNYKVPAMTYLASSIYERLYIDWVRLYDSVQATTLGTLSQYKLDGTTEISAGGWTNESGAILKLNATSPYTTDGITPQFELRTTGTNFTNANTNAGSIFTYSGSTATGTVTLSSLSDGQTYHWQARSLNVAGGSAWSTKGGSPDFGVDLSAPSGGSVTYTDGYTNTTSVSGSVGDGSDSASGINTSNRTLQRKTATLTDNVCGSYGSYETIASSLSYPSFTDTSVSNGHCYQYRYLTSDVAGNQTTYTSSNTIKVDTTSPTISSVNSSTQTASTANISWNTTEKSSTKVEYGLTTNYGHTTNETDTTTGVTSHSADLSSLSSCTTYHYRVRSKDLAQNNSLSTDKTFTTSGCTGGSTVVDETAASVSSSSGGSLEVTSGTTTISLSIPSAYSSQDATFQAHKISLTSALSSTPNPSGYSGTGDGVYELKALTDVNTTISTFDNPITITLGYSNLDISTAEESSLRIWRYDNGQWYMLSNCTTNTTEKTVTCETTNFSLFGLFKPASAVASNPSGSPSCTDDPPGARAPWLYAAVPESQSKIRLYFTEVNDPVDSYSLVFGEKTGVYQYGLTNIGGKGTTNYLVNDLQPGKTYYFKIQGKHGCQPGAWSNEMSATTKSKKNFSLSLSSSPSISLTPESAPSTSQPQSADNAQDDYELNIVVTDTSGRPINGAKITVDSTSGELTSDQNGQANVGGLVLGDHTVNVSYQGSQSNQVVNLSGANHNLKLTVSLRNEKKIKIYLSIVLFITIAIVTMILIRKKHRDKPLPN